MKTIDYQHIPTAVIDLCRRLRRDGFAAYLVGGSVRDLLLGRDVQDWDVTTAAPPDKVIKSFRRTIPTGIRHGTVTVLLGRGPQVEVTTFRGEGAYLDGRRPERVEFVGDVAEDLERRDFTVNAIALDPVDRQVVDPMGGIADLERQVIRAVGDPRARFAEDGLRTLRAIRLATVLDFSIAPTTLEAIPGALATLRRVSAERQRDELLKVLASDRASVGIQLMRSTGVLGVLLPEISNHGGLVDGAALGPGSRDALYEGALAFCDRLPPDPTLRLAAVLGLAGGSAAVESAMTRLRLSNAQRERAQRLLGAPKLALLEADPVVLRRWLSDVGLDAVPELLRWREAELGDHSVHLAELRQLRGRIDDVLSGGPALTRGDLAVDGRDIVRRIGRPPGRYVGQIIDRLLDRVIEDPTLNERHQLLEIVDALAEELSDQT